MKTLAVSVGDNCVDHYLAPIDRNFVGGNALNVAVAIQNAGYPAAYLGFIGDDEDGKLILSELNRAGVDTSMVKTLAGNTACTQVRLTSSGDRQFIHEDLGPKDAFILTKEDIQFINRHRLVHATFLGGTEDYLPQFADNTSLIVSFDYSERSLNALIDRTIQFVDIAFFSLPEDATTTMEELARQMYGRGPKMIVVTQGRLGSLVFDGIVYAQPAMPIEVVDTLGAGDAYIGTFLSNWLLGKPIPECMETATKIAGETCTHFGGF
jgi:fructoselysine 6-kinase